MACAGPMRPIKLPGYYLKQRAALQRTEEPEPLYTKPTAIIIDSGSDLKTTPGSANNIVAIKLLITKESTELQECEGERNGKILSCSIVARAIKKRMRPYRRYMCETIELLQDRVFMAFCIAIFLFSLGAFPPVLFMEDVAQSEGLIDGIALIPLVSIVAMTTGIGKLVLGVLADMRWVNSLYLYALTLTGTGLTLLLIPVSKSYLALQVLSAMVGFFSGNWSLTSYITTKIVGMERLSQAHGILMCFGGFGITLGPPVVGKNNLHK